MEYPIPPDGLPSEELDLRFLIIELCQPLEHLKAEYERMLCDGQSDAECSPFELDYRDASEGYPQAEFCADLAGIYRAFAFTDNQKLPLRPDHIAYELEFMRWLISRRRLAIHMASLDQQASSEAARYDLAERAFFSDHLACWAQSFAGCLQTCTGGGYLEPLGRFLSALVPFERHYLGQDSGLGQESVERQEAHVGA
jgi:TorA maturation chaperone TorD